MQSLPSHSHPSPLATPPSASGYTTAGRPNSQTCRVDPSPGQTPHRLTRSPPSIHPPAATHTLRCQAGPMWPGSSPVTICASSTRGRQTLGRHRTRDKPDQLGRSVVESYTKNSLCQTVEKAWLRRLGRRVSSWWWRRATSVARTPLPRRESRLRSTAMARLAPPATTVCHHGRGHAGHVYSHAKRRCDGVLQIQRSYRHRLDRKAGDCGAGKPGCRLNPVSR